MRTALALATLLLLGTTVSAQSTEQLQAQLQALNAQVAQLQGQGQGGALCRISRTLSQGMRGDDVHTLQAYLIQQQFLSADSATGYFGPRTRAALVQWQLRVGIITRAEDGGIFGRLSRQFVATRLCAGTPTPVPQCPSPPAQPTNITCTGVWQKLIDRDNCHNGWTCMPGTATTTSGNRPPTIHAVVGPTFRNVAQSGTWNISATDPDRDTLKYSVIWGDEGTSLTQLLDIAGQGQSFSSATSWTHAYNNPGAYSMIVFARDPAGKDNKAVLNVEVRDPTPVATTTVVVVTEPSTTGGVLTGQCTFGGIGYLDGMRLKCGMLNRTVGGDIIQSTCSPDLTPGLGGEAKNGLGGAGATCRNGTWITDGGGDACAQDSRFCTSFPAGGSLMCAIPYNQYFNYITRHTEYIYTEQCATGGTPCPDQYLLCNNGKLQIPAYDPNLKLPAGGCWRTDFFTGRKWVALCYPSAVYGPVCGKSGCSY